MLKVSELAALAQISVRTLHYYDELGLLQPDVVTDAGYRLYSDENIEKLQHILFYRQLDMPLKQIKSLLNDSQFDRVAALETHREKLLQQKIQLEVLINNVQQSIIAAKGGATMSHAEKFAGFSFEQNVYEQEARERWGDDVVDKANSKMKGEFGQQLAAQMNEVYRELAMLRHTDPSSEQAQVVIGKWYTILNGISSYTPEMFRSLGDMYVSDERFTRNIDQFGIGLAKFMKEAMNHYASALENGTSS